MNIFGGHIILKNRNLFSQTALNSSPAGPFIILSTTESTNNYAMAKLHAGMLVSGTCILALEQTAGKGQRGKQWMAASGENITMSTVFQMRTLMTAHHGAPSAEMFPLIGNKPIPPFVFSAAIALGCYDFIKDAGIENVSVKWPNDVYIGDRKAAGILIENMYQGSFWQWAIAGIGVNLNQTSFPDLQSKAVSLKQLSGIDYTVSKEGKRLHLHLLERIKSLSPEEIMREYNSLLYKKGMEVRLKKGAAAFSTVIKEVNTFGELVTMDTMERNFTVGEVAFL